MSFTNILIYRLKKYRIIFLEKIVKKFFIFLSLLGIIAFNSHGSRFEDMHVQEGDVTIQRLPNKIIVTQVSPFAVIQWDKINLNDGLEMQVIQPDADSILINHVNNKVCLDKAPESTGRFIIMSSEGIEHLDTIFVKRPNPSPLLNQEIQDWGYEVIKGID